MPSIRDELPSDQVLNNSLGSTIEVFELILSGTLDNGLIFLNQPSIQNQLIHYATNKYSKKRILVIDWDVGYNSQTQKSFYDNSRVLCVSIHQFQSDVSPSDSDFYNIGDENALGFNVNIPLNNVSLNDLFFNKI